jgi:hypothetical protein
MTATEKDRRTGPRAATGGIATGSGPGLRETSEE